MTQEALRMAHKALIGLSIKHDEMTDEGMDAITAIEKALAKEKTLQALHSENERLGLYKDAYAQPEQEPVAWADIQKEAQQIVESKFLWKQFIDGTPLANDIAVWMADFAKQHTTPPQRIWQGLTNEEVESYWDWEDFQCGCGRGTLLEMVLDIQDKLKERNT